jgi:hypothetical protein
VVLSIAIVVLGLSAALVGAWLERAGPRKAMAVAAACFGGGFLVAAPGSGSNRSGHCGWGAALGSGL